MSSLIGEYLVLTRNTKIDDPMAVLPPTKIKVVSVEGDYAITSDGKKISSLDLLDGLDYIKQDLSTINLGMGQQFTNKHIPNNNPVNIPALSDEPSFVPQQFSNTRMVPDPVAIKPKYTEHQNFVDSAIQIAKKQNKVFEHELTVTINIPFDINFIQTTAAALNVSLDDIVKVLSDNVDIDLEAIKYDLIAKILGVSSDEIIPKVVEVIVEDPVNIVSEIKDGYAEVSVLANFFHDVFTVMVDLSRDRQEVISFDFNLQQFLTDPEKYYEVIKKIKEMDSQLIDDDPLNGDKITFDFKEDLYYTMLDKLRSTPVVEIEPLETVEDKEDTSIDLKEIEETKAKTKNLPNIQKPKTLLDIWNRK